MNDLLRSVLFSLAIFWPAAALGQGTVFLDYTNFETRLGELAGSAGVDNFSASEVTTLKAGIKTNLETMYAGFDGITFTETDPGGTRAELVFGLTGGGLGVADHIDFLNRDLNDTGRVFTASFTFIVDEFSGSTNRSAQLNQLTAALSGTAAHELGHNLGLRHHDAHGNLQYEGNAISTGGNEDLRVMATGSTGLNETQRETLRDFSVNSLVKLAYADQTLLAGNPTALNEVGDAGDTRFDAQVVDFETIPVANRFGEAIIGVLDSNSDVDVYEVELAANSLFTIDINNDYASSVNNDFVDTIIALLDDDGNIIYSNDDTLYTSTQFGAGSRRSTDSILYNVDILTAGTYFVQVGSFNASGSGDYQLLLHTDMLAAIPEPSSATLCCIALTGCLARRRRTQS